MKTYGYQAHVVYHKKNGRKVAELFNDRISAEFRRDQLIRNHRAFLGMRETTLIEVPLEIELENR